MARASHQHSHGDLEDPSSVEVHAEVSARLRADAQRYTPSRQALVEALLTSSGPLALPELLERCDGVPQSSAYRNLAVLERAGAVHRVASSDEFGRFELVEDLMGHHHHLICESCGAVTDFTVPAKLERELDAQLLRAADAAGFSLEQHRLDLLGICQHCQQAP